MVPPLVGLACLVAVFALAQSLSRFSLWEASPWIGDFLKKSSVRLLSTEAEPAHFLKDLVSGFGPLERLPFLVVGVDLGVRQSLSDTLHTR